MPKIYLICDESGSKGFSNMDEKFEGDFGVFAGYFIDENILESTKKDLNQIYKKFLKTEVKLHITDLSQDEQSSLRTEIFDYIRKHKINWSYEAISVKGFKVQHDEIKELEKGNVEKLKDKFSFSKNSTEERLHSELFLGLFAKSIAYYLDNYGEDDININVITDNIDKPLIKEFDVLINEFLKLFPSQQSLKSFDKEKKQPVTKEVRLESSEFLNDSISYAKHNINVEDNGLTLVADILANTVNHYLKEGILTNPDLNLNHINSIREHPLSEFIYGCSDENNINIVSDRLYKRRV